MLLDEIRTKRSAGRLVTDGLDEQRACDGAEMRLGIVGKGGSGKSTIAGTLARVLARQGHRVLAFDLDFMPGMGLSIGADVGDEPMFAVMAERQEKTPFGWRAKLHPELREMTVANSRCGPDGVRFLQLGKVAKLPPEEALTSSVGACYEILRRIGEGASLADWSLVCDHPAGMIQSTGGWVAYADTFVIVVEPSGHSVLTARRLLGLRKNSRVVLVANRTTGADDLQFIESSLGEPVSCVVPSDLAVSASGQAGVALIDHAPDSPAVRAVEALAHHL